MTAGLLIGGAMGVVLGGGEYFLKKYKPAAPNWAKTAAIWLAVASRYIWQVLNALLWLALAMLAAFSLALTALPDLDPSLRAADAALKAVSLGLHRELYPPMAILTWMLTFMGCSLNLQTARTAVPLCVASLVVWHLLSFGLERFWA